MMPPKIKKELSMSIIIIMLGGLMTGLMGFGGVELIKAHDNNVNAKNIVKQLDNIELENKEFISRADALLSYFNENKMNIKVLDMKVEERFFMMHDKVNYNTNQITYLKGRLKGNGGR